MLKFYIWIETMKWPWKVIMNKREYVPQETSIYILISVL